MQGSVVTNRTYPFQFVGILVYNAANFTREQSLSPVRVIVEIGRFRHFDVKWRKYTHISSSKSLG